MWVNFVNAVEPRTASFRYRSIWPSMALAELGHECLITDDPDQVPLDRATHGIVFSKAFNQKSLELGWRAHNNDVPIVLDVCDNIFVPNYLGGTAGLLTVACFRAMAEFANCILVPTHALGEVVRQQLAGTQLQIHVVPDCVEQETDVRELLNALQESSSCRIPLSPNCTIVRSSKQASLKRSGQTLGKWLPASLQKTPKKLAYLLRAAVSNDFNSNRAAIRARVAHFIQSLPGSLYAKRPSWPRLDKKCIANSAATDRKTVLWFGNAGQAHGNYGIPTVLRFANELIRINEQQPIELLIVSNNQPKFREYIRRLPIPSRYAEWDPVAIFDHLRSADLVILPNSNDSFSRTKSANRVLLALSQGVPVVAEDFAGLEALRNCVACDDIYQGLERYLIEKRKKADLEIAQSVLDTHFSRRRIGEQLSSVFRDIKAHDLRSRPCLLFMFDLLQDVEVLKPVLNHFANRADWRVRVLVSNWLMSQPDSPRDYFKNCELTPIVLEREELLASSPAAIDGADLVFLASETNLGPHRVAHHIANEAARKNIPAVTFQHGLENEGLTYFGENKAVKFASKKIVVWNDLPSSMANITRETRNKCLPIGIFRSTESRAFPSAMRERLPCDRFIGVFENLHWERYSDYYRSEFLHNLITTARSNADCCFLVKPHPAGQWFALSDRVPYDLPPNVVTIDNTDDEWKHISGTQLVRFVDAVITTPSTIAIDAAIAKVPIAVVAQSMGTLDMYSGLDMLHHAEDWNEFVGRCVDDQSPILARVNRFLSERVSKLNPLEELEVEVSKLVVG
ncbi:MAG: glycosyltransferase [Pseudomonadales bacterium]